MTSGGAPLLYTVFGKRSFLSKESDTLRSYTVQQGSHSVISKKPRLFMKKPFVYEKKQKCTKQMNANT